MPVNKTIKRSIYDPEIASPDSASAYSADMRDLSFLSGSENSNDMGYRGGGMPGYEISEPGDDWRTRYERKARLIRHTHDQGMSTFSFPKDAISKKTGE